ncbi:hypothetical protein GCM10027605_30700 [Micromonospora zhanjiangensis]
MSKTFAGARLRRMREDRSLSQAHLARLLNISPSYLNQIEHDARPLTVPVLMRITEVFGVDPTVFAPRDTPRLVAGLREALAGRAGVADLTELATRLPELAEAVLDLHRRYRQADEQLAELIGDREAVGRSPHDRVTEFFYRRQNYVPDLDEAAERLAATVGLRRGEVRTALRDRLAERHGVQVRHDDAAALGDELHRYRPQTRTLHLSASLRAGQEAMRMAAQIALLEYADVIDEIVEEERFDDIQTQILTRVGLANYFAAALILPYEQFLVAAEHRRYDIDLLTQHFAIGWETVCHRLSTLQRPRARGCRSPSSGSTGPATCPSASPPPASRSPTPAARVRCGTSTRRSARPAGSSSRWRRCPTGNATSGSPAPSPATTAATTNRARSTPSGSAARSGTPTGWSTPPGWTCTRPTPPPRSVPVARPASG